MSEKDNFIYAAILTYISWQSVASGPSYRLQDFKARLDKASGVEFPTEAVEEAVRRMASEGFAEVIETGFSQPYIKLNYKPVAEHVAQRVENAASPEYKFRRLGRPVLAEALSIPQDAQDRLEAEPDDAPPPALTQQARERLIVQLGSAIVDLDNHNLSNEVKAQAGAYLTAARTLAEAPEPLVGTIWELISRANELAGIASLLVAIMALFTHG